MKKLITTASLILITAFAFAQDNYTVKMNMKTEGLPPEYAGFGEMEMTKYAKGDKYKNEINSMMMTSTSVFDGKTLVSVSETMGNKTGFTATKEELDAAKNTKSETKPKVEYTKEKKTIAGYECSKALVTTVGKDKKENIVTVWVTDKLKNHESNKMEMTDLGDIKGVPLEIEMSQVQGPMTLKILITTAEVTTTPIDDKIFEVKTDGYKMSTYKEYVETMKKQKGGQ